MRVLLVRHPTEVCEKRSEKEGVSLIIGRASSFGFDRFFSVCSHSPSASSDDAEEAAEDTDIDDEAAEDLYSNSTSVAISAACERKRVANSETTTAEEGGKTALGS
jgi:hypothetical protein